MISDVLKLDFTVLRVVSVFEVPTVFLFFEVSL